MNLLIEYFTSSNPNRDAEYKFCISQNLNNSLIHKIFVFISDNSTLGFESDKIEIVKREDRPTFLDLFKFCNDNLSNQICIIANTDIFFDNSLSELNEFNLDNILLSLTRWDVNFDGKNWFKKFYDNPWWECYQSDGTINEEESITTSQFSQDSWIFRSPIKIDERSNFLMGKPGCDNRIAQIVHETGLDVRNPSKKIITYHYHQTNYRTYDNTHLVPGPYLLIKSTNDLSSKSKLKTIPSFYKI